MIPRIQEKEYHIKRRGEKKKRFQENWYLIGMSGDGVAKNKESREPTNPLNREGEAPPCKYLPHKSSWQNGRPPAALDIPLHSFVRIYIYTTFPVGNSFRNVRFWIGNEICTPRVAGKTQASKKSRGEARAPFTVYRFIGRSLGQLRIPTGERVNLLVGEGVANTQNALSPSSVRDRS